MEQDCQPDHFVGIVTIDRLCDTGGIVVHPCCPHGVDMRYGVVVSLLLSVVSSQDYLVFAIDNVSSDIILITSVRLYEVPECIPSERGHWWLVAVCPMHVTHFPCLLSCYRRRRRKSRCGQTTMTFNRAARQTGAGITTEIVSCVIAVVLVVAVVVVVAGALVTRLS